MGVQQEGEKPYKVTELREGLLRATRREDGSSVVVNPGLATSGNEMTDQENTLGGGRKKTSRGNPRSPDTTRRR